MSILDLRTIFFSSVITSAICAMVMSSLWRNNRRRWPELGYWFADFIMQFLAILLLALRGVMPDMVSMTLGVPLIVTGTYLLFLGLQRYTGKTSPQRYNVIFLGLLFLVHLYFAYLRPSLPARNINFSIGMLVICGECAWLLLVRANANERPKMQATGVIFSLFCVVSVLRILADLFFPGSNDLFKSGLYDILVILIFQMLFIGLTFSLFLMVNRRLLIALEHDIVERKRAEDALLEKEARYRLLFNSMLDGFALHEIICDENGRPSDYRFLEANPAFEQMTGLNSADIAGKTILQVLPNVEKYWIDTYGKVALTGKAVRFENFSQPLGKHYEVAAFSPRQKMFATFFIDITERKHIEARLLESEEKFRHLFEHSPLGKSMTGIDGSLHVNKAFCEIVGYTEEELKDKKWTDISHPDDIAATNHFVKLLLERKLDQAHFEKRYLHKNGQTVWAEVSTYLERNEQGEPLFFITTISDVTERKKNSELLQETSDYLENLFNYTNAPIIVWDPEFQITRFNHAFERLTGRSAEEVVGKHLELLFPDESRETSMAFISQTQSGERWETVEIPILQRDGSVRLVLWNSANLIAGDGQTIVATIAQGQDITERKQAEATLKNYLLKLEAMVDDRTMELRLAQEKLVRQERLAILGQLAGSIGHELRNPLGVIANAAYFLRLVSPQADAKITQYIGIIETETRNADRIITDLLDFSRVKSADQQTVAVADLLRQVLERFPVPDYIAVDFMLPEDLPSICVDPRQISQVLGNLVTNACQAMPEGGRLTFSAEQAGSGELALAVTDSGVGISPENMARLFEPLFTTRPKGIGLGLAVSRKLAEANGGRIEVRSEVSQGSTFTIFLPINAIQDWNQAP